MNFPSLRWNEDPDELKRFRAHQAKEEEEHHNHLGSRNTAK